MADSTKPRLDNIPDPDDDLDDLDDVLEDFSSKPSPAAAPPSASSASFATTSGRPRNNTRVDAKPPSVPGLGPPLNPANEVDEDELSSEFAKELAKGMESLMREIGNELPSGAPDGSEETSEALKAAWEAMLVSGMNGQAGDELLPSLGDILGDKNPQAGGAARSGGAASGENFQERIKQAMDKMKESESNLRSSSSAGGAGGAADDASPESIEALLKSLGDLGLGEGGESDTELAGFLESMMSQLMSKDILYEPLKELSESFPPYLANPPQPLSSEDRVRYEKQLVCAKKIVAAFDQPSYSDADPVSNKIIVDLMSEMQAHGSPPTELMGDLPAGFDTALPGSDPNNPEGCTIA